MITQKRTTIYIPASSIVAALDIAILEQELKEKRESSINNKVFHPSILLQNWIKTRNQISNNGKTILTDDESILDIHCPTNTNK